MEREIINEFLAHMRQNGGVGREWYVGITDDPRSRLFNDHRVSETTGAWIYRDAGTINVARAVEQYLLDQGCDGGSGGGSTQSHFVYAYRRTASTNENA